MAATLTRCGPAFAVGVVIFHWLPVLPWDLSWLFLLLLAGLAWVFAWARLPFFLLLGVCWAQLHACALLCDPFPDDLAREPLVLEGRVASIPARRGDSLRFLFRVERVSGTEGAVPFRGLVRLTWYRNAPDLMAGERWRLPVRLKSRHGYSNPGGFDYERWLFEQGVEATGHIRGGDGLARLEAGSGPYWLTRWRQALADHLAQVLGEHRSLGLVQALAIGETSGFAPEDWEVLALTGTTHLVAISGLNVGMIAGVLFVAIRWLWSRSASLVQALAAPRAAVLFASFGALGYAGLAGFSVPTQRALIMLGVVFAALFWQRTLRPAHALLVALIGVLLIDPQAILSFGFWLSFGGVAILLYNLGQRLPSRDLWSRWGRAQWAVTVGLLPLVLLLFGRVSVIAPAVNVIAVPLFTLLLLPLVLIAGLMSLIPGLSWPLIWTAELLGWCMDGLGWIANWPWAAEGISGRPGWVWCAAVAGVALILAPRGLPGRWLGLVLLIPLGAIRPPGPGWGEAWFSLLDVGQGLALVVRTRDGTLVYDTGPGYPSGFNTGGAVLVPFLRNQGVERVGRLVLSHADRDHAGGANELIESLPIDRIDSGEPERLGLAGVAPCRAGEGWTWSGVTFRYLHPDGPGDTGNGASCALRMDTGGRSLLLVGDLDQGVERRLIERFGSALRSDILVAGHHGSKTSSSEAFLESVAPRWLLFSSGYANQFGFPSSEVRERAARRGIAMLDTARAGAITVRFGPGGAMSDPVRWRDQYRRIWTHRPGSPP